MNSEAYTSALFNLVENGTEDLFPFSETKINFTGRYYKVLLDISNVTSGDIIDHIYVNTTGLTRIGIKIDDVLVWCSDFENVSEALVKPFYNGLPVVSCDRSQIVLYIVCTSPPLVTSMYRLLRGRRFFFRRKQAYSDGTCVMNGYFCSLRGANSSVNHQVCA
jgi:hypothetical protein